MKINSAFSSKSDPADVVRDVVRQLQVEHPRVVMFFSSSAFDHAQLARSFKEVYPNAEVIGCTTAGELTSGKMATNSVVAMALPGDLVVDAKGVLVNGPGDRRAVKESFSVLERHFRAEASAWNYEDHVGIVLVDGLSNAEEQLMDSIGDFTGVQFVGGSAGDDVKFQRTEVSLNGESRSNAAVLLLMKVQGEFEVIKTQSFRVLPKKLTATKVDERTRTVLEFDHRPAASAYAEALGVSPSELSSQFMAHPLGLMAGSEPYVRSPQRLDGENVVFYCNVREGAELSVLESGDIVGDTAEALRQKQAAWGGISALINFNCILRTLELQNKKQTEAYGKVFAQVPTVGFSTYGEAFVGHVNQTATILAFR